MSWGLVRQLVGIIFTIVALIATIRIQQGATFRDIIDRPARLLPCYDDPCSVGR